MRYRHFHYLCTVHVFIFLYHSMLYFDEVGLIIYFSCNHCCANSGMYKCFTDVCCIHIFFDRVLKQHAAVVSMNLSVIRLFTVCICFHFSLQGIY